MDHQTKQLQQKHHTTKQEQTIQKQVARETFYNKVKICFPGFHMREFKELVEYFSAKYNKYN